MGEKWEVYIGRNETTQRDYLIIRCGDGDCVARVEAELRKQGEDMDTANFTWKIFDVTGQFDDESMLYIPNTTEETEAKDPDNLN
jgi:hypothetical protein